MKIECAYPCRQKAEHTAVGTGGRQMCTHTWPPATVIVPTNSGRWRYLLPTIPFSAHLLLTIPKLHWLFANQKEIVQMADIKQLYWCFLNFFSIRKNAKTNLLATGISKFLTRAPRNLETPIFSYFVCCHSPHVHHPALLVFSNKLNFLYLFFFIYAELYWEHPSPREQPAHLPEMSLVLQHFYLLLHVKYIY